MKRVLFFVAAILPHWLHAQQGYRVEYDYNDILLPMTINGEKRMVRRTGEVLVIGDSLALQYRPGYGSVKKNGVYGAKALHHSRFTRRSGDWFYEVVAWPKRNDPYLISDTIYSRAWVLTGEKKKVLQYDCERAFHLNTLSDTISAWFTRELPIPLGPSALSGLPGLILEAEMHKKDILIRAGKIEMGDFKVGLPRVEKVYSSEEYRNFRKKPATAAQ